jgi:hydrophobe/amphiphile efflux-1 (HAE1) family protein
MWITRTSIRQPVFATMVMVALLVLGLFAYWRLPVEQMPDIAPPMASIALNYPGAAPEAIENSMIRPIENVINTISGIDKIFATAREGGGYMWVEMYMTADPVEVTQQIRDKIADIAPAFPRDALPPRVTRTMEDENQQPIVTLAVHSKVRTLRELSTLTDQVIVKHLQNQPGVGNVAVSGEVPRQVQVLLNPEQMRSYGVGVDEVVAAIQRANRDLPAGNLQHEGGEQIVRVEGRLKEPRDFGRIIVATRGSALYLQQGGLPVHLDQVAEVVDGEAEPDSLARIDGEPALGLEVFRVQQANVVEVGDAVLKAVKELEDRLPEDVRVSLVQANSDFVRNSLEGVKITILEGAALTVLIVFLFLHSWRSTVITGLTLPISVIATFMALYMLGFTLNMVTLMALSLCIGLLIDDAIVVRENIVRHLAMGKSHAEAARDGTEEIGLAVMATTFAIVAVFVPVAFMGGMIGRIFFQFGITITVAVLLSLFVSFTLDPMLSSVWRDPVENRFRWVPWLGRLMERVEAVVEGAHRLYGRVLAWALREDRHRAWLPVFGLTHAARQRDWRHIGTISNRGIVLWSAAAVFVGSFALLPLIGQEFFPPDDDGFIRLRLQTAVGSSLEYTDAKTRQVEEALKEFPEVRLVSAEVGTFEGRNSAHVNVRLSPRDERERSQTEIIRDIRARLNRIAGIQLQAGWQEAIAVSILGPDQKRLTALSEELMARVARIPGVADLESSEKGTSPSVSVKVDRELANDLGLDVERIGRALRVLVAGDKVSRWLGPDGQDYDVVVRLPREQRQEATDLGELYLSSGRLDADGLPVLVPLRQVATLAETTAPPQLKRLDLQRRVTLYMRADGRPSGDVGNDVQKLVAETELPRGYRFTIGGSQEQMDETFREALAAMGLAVIFIYLILASQFASFVQPVAIMASLPLSFVGAFLALLITGTTLNMLSMIGMILLMGLVTKNAILLVDFTNQSLREGKSLHEALMAAGQIRLRPILMTTLAMIFGMLPMAIGQGAGGDMNAPMARAVIGGVITSTLLTLVVVPVLYTYLHRFSLRARRWWGLDEPHPPAVPRARAPHTPHAG